MNGHEKHEIHEREDGAGKQGRQNGSIGGLSLNLQTAESAVMTATPCADLLYRGLSYDIQGAAFEVYRELGPGMLEKVYESALSAELNMRGLNVNAQVRFPVRYKQCLIGEYLAYLVVERCVVVEVKAQASLHAANMAQLLTILRCRDCGWAT
ncbi:MAG TPA: GxxExxY protein [Steroidobacteraceae bacterium]|nr:GxxExxY protein [Steroidobacteraceae bacterium]